jgi:hypothetical protein
LKTILTFNCFHTTTYVLPFSILFHINESHNGVRFLSDEDRKVMADINDYIKNYSDLTFDEYKQLKHGKQ